MIVLLPAPDTPPGPPFPLLYRQRAILQHIRLPVIGEGHMVQFNAVVLREWPASFKDRKLQDLLHLSHTAESLGKGGGHLLERQDLRQIHAAHIGKEQKHAGAHRARRNISPRPGSSGAYRTPPAAGKPHRAARFYGSPDSRSGFPPKWRGKTSETTGSPCCTP